MAKQNIQGIFKTKGINLENGKPNVVALMFNENKGISLDGGAMAAGVSLGFSGSQSFNLAQWDKLNKAEYEALLRSQAQGRAGA